MKMPNAKTLALFVSMGLAMFGCGDKGSDPAPKPVNPVVVNPPISNHKQTTVFNNVELSAEIGDAVDKDGKWVKILEKFYVGNLGNRVNGSFVAVTAVETGTPVGLSLSGLDAAPLQTQDVGINTEIKPAGAIVLKMFNLNGQPISHGVSQDGSTLLESDTLIFITDKIKTYVEDKKTITETLKAAQENANKLGTKLESFSNPHLSRDINFQGLEFKRNNL